MKLNKLTTTFITVGAFAISAFAAEANQEKIYLEQCVKCHGTHGEGNPLKKGPAVNNKSVGDLQIAIMDLQGVLGINGGSSGENVNMEHNIKVFEKKGYIIDAGGMAKYMYNSFNPAAKKR